ncbi:uncharacterized protein LOC141617657 [Silene latifolia]|uniref:uncharacterized protein LOC141617657 n=1 Tax=Silene latifolia TaxID=37657 RepID=UPI003D78425C
MAFPDTSTTFLPEGLFDHNPCVLDIWRQQNRRKMSFKYFNMWGSDEKFLTTVAQVWEQNISGITMFQVVRKMKMLKQGLKSINREAFANVEASARIAKVNLENIQLALQQDVNNRELLRQEMEAGLLFQAMDKARNAYLAHKAKTQWMEEGDANTHYFHSAIKSRRILNKVYAIRDTDGNQCVDERGIEGAFLDYYKKLLGTNKAVKRVHFPTVQRGRVLNDVQKQRLML